MDESRRDILRRAVRELPGIADDTLAVALIERAQAVTISLVERILDEESGDQSSYFSKLYTVIADEASHILRNIADNAQDTDLDNAEQTKLARAHTATADFHERYTADLRIINAATTLALDDARQRGLVVTKVDGNETNYGEEGFRFAYRAQSTLFQGYIEQVAAVLAVPCTGQAEAKRGPKQPGRKRAGIKPVRRPLVLPNEPGHRALIYASTTNLKSWDITDERITLRTALTFDNRHPLDVTMSYGSADALATAVEQLRATEDGTTLKTLLALPALFFDHNPHAKYNAIHEITVADLMRYMGLKPKDGAFDREDQRRIWRSIQFLAKIWIPAVVSHKVKGKQVVTGQGAWYSPLIVLQGIQEGAHGVDLPQAIRYSLGKECFSYYIGEQGEHTRMMRLSPRIMEFHARRDVNPLRLSVYYASQFRIRKLGVRFGHTNFKVKYETLLLQAGIPIDKKNPTRQFHRVCDWHGELIAKGIIGNYSHTASPPSRSSFKDYASLVFTIERHDDEVK